MSSAMTIGPRKCLASVCILAISSVIAINRPRIAQPDVATQNVQGGLEQGRAAEQRGLPFLPVLDAEGKVATAQETGVLEEGDHHDAKRVAAFLDQWKVLPKDAKRVLDEAISRASSDDKWVFLTFGAPWCGWCHRLHDWMA